MTGRRRALLVAAGWLALTTGSLTALGIGLAIVDNRRAWCPCGSTHGCTHGGTHGAHTAVTAFPESPGQDVSRGLTA